MSEQIIDRILNEAEYDASREDSIRAIAREPFQRPHRSVLVVVVFFLLLFTSLAICTAVLFFAATETWFMILYATLFNVLMLCIGATRLFLWQTIHRGQIQRDIRRLEARVAELTSMLVQQPDRSSTASRDA